MNEGGAAASSRAKSPPSLAGVFINPPTAGDRDEDRRQPPNDGEPMSSHPAVGTRKKPVRRSASYYARQDRRWAAIGLGHDEVNGSEMADFVVGEITASTPSSADGLSGPQMDYSAFNGAPSGDDGAEDSQAVANFPKKKKFRTKACIAYHKRRSDEKARLHNLRKAANAVGANSGASGIEKPDFEALGDVRSDAAAFCGSENERREIFWHRRAG